MRIVTDPVVDLVAFTLQHILLPPILAIFTKVAMFALQVSVGSHGAKKVSEQINDYVSERYYDLNA